MSKINLHWYLPTNGDSRFLTGSGNDSHTIGTSGEVRLPNLSYLIDVARAAEAQGFHAVLTPTGSWCEDAWIVTSAISQATENLKFLVAFRPGLISPTLLAQQAATFQRITSGRLILNVVTGGDRFEQARFGDYIEHDARYDRTAEFLTILRGLGESDKDKPFSFEGNYFNIQNAWADFQSCKFPLIFFGGASDAAQKVAASLADVQLNWGQSPEQEASKIKILQNLALKQERKLCFGIRLHVISRDTESEAWAVADSLLRHLPNDAVRKARELLKKSESVAQRQMLQLNASMEDVPKRARDLEFFPGIWSGFGLVRGGAGTALVGSHQQVADLIEKYHKVGFDHFILSGQPHLEEAWHFGEGAMAILRKRGLLAAVAERNAI